MAQPGDFAATVKQQADIVRIVGEYVKLRKAGALVRCRQRALPQNRMYPERHAAGT